jgi:hypothetical protein
VLVCAEAEVWVQSASRLWMGGVDYGLNVRHVDDLHHWMEAMEGEDAEGCDPTEGRRGKGEPAAIAV